MAFKKYTFLITLLITCSLFISCTKNPNTDESTTSPIDSSSTSELYAAYQWKDDQKLYGFINIDGEFIIEPAYTYVTDFSEDLATVYDGNLFRVIDKTGQIIFESKGSIEPFKNGAAIITDYDTYKEGFIDPSGKIIVKPIYQSAENFGIDGTAMVSKSEGTFEVIDKSAKVVKTYPLDAAFEMVYDTKDGYASYVHRFNDDYKLGIVSIADGKIIIEPTFNDILNLGEGFFAAKNPSAETYDSMITPAAIFDHLGKQLSDYQYFDISPFHDGLASATDEKYTFFIGTDGQKVTTLPTVEGRGTLRKVGSLIKSEINGDLSYLDTNGVVIWKGDSTRVLSDTIKVSEIGYAPSRLINIKYPSVEGIENEAIQSEINEILKAYFTNARSEEYMNNLSVEDDFSAKLLSNLLVIGKNGYDYYAGAAHGMPIQDFYYIDITTGAFYTFKDLFKADSGYLEALSKIVRAQIQKQMENEDSMFFPDAFTSLTDSSYFILGDQGIIIYFYPYEISAYAGGFPEFKIPFADIESYIDTEGAFWKSFNP